MKRTPARTLFALLLAVVLVLGLAAPAFAETTMLSAQKLTVNGAAVECEKYNIDGYNYFKLRDLAQLLNGTASQFNVDYDKAAKQMIVTTGVPYTTPNGTELKVGADNSASAMPTIQTLVVDGEVRSDLTAYNIGGSNFFKLRDLGKVLHFYVHYDKATNTAIVDASEEDEAWDTGDAGLDNPRNQDGMGATEVLVVSFGTSFNDSRRLTIGAIEEAMEKAFPGYDVRRGFTAQIVIDHIALRDDEIIDNFGEALQRAVDNGVSYLLVQPTHLMDGFEYNDVKAELAEYADKFETIVLGDPLLTSDEDYDVVIEAITEATKQYDDGKTAICFMGHGTEAASNHVYADFQAKLTEKGFVNYFVGTVEAEPDVFDVLEQVKAGGYEKVVLRPLMIVAGDHANNDMADLEDEESWASIFTAAGFEVECVLEGLGQLPAIQDLLVEHLKTKAAEALDEDYGTGDASLDDPRNADGIGEKEILVVSFGTSFNGSRVQDIKGIEDAIAAAYPDWSVRRAFTAQIIINHIQARDGEKIDNMEQAMERAVANGVKTLVIQPTHLMHGAEYDEMMEMVAKYDGKIETIQVAEPLLGEVGADASVINADKAAVAEYVTTAAVEASEFDTLAAADAAKTAFVFMGHGTSHTANVTYSQMQTQMNALGYKNVFIGTVEGLPASTACEAVIEAVKAGGYTNVILRPLMVVAGDHANNDMADPEDEESWYSMFSAAGLNVECQIAGLGGIDEVQALYVAHTGVALAGEAAAPAEEAGAAAETLADGSYYAKFNTDSSMFKANQYVNDGKSILTVKDGKMTIHVVLNSKNIVNLFLGSKEDAQAEGAVLLQPTEETVSFTDGSPDEVAYAFDIPVEALDTDFACALIGTKGTWYDHTVSVSDVEAMN